MRLTIKDGNKGNGAHGAGTTRGINATPANGNHAPGGTSGPLLATVLRAVDGAAEELEEAVRQILNGVVPYVPRIRVRETRDAIIVSGRLRDVPEDSVELTFVGRSLKIHGAKIKLYERNRRAYRSVEKVYRTFERTIPMDCDIDRDKVVATLGNEVLRIHVPKKAGLPVPSSSVSADSVDAA